MRTSLVINKEYPFSKIGINEVAGLRSAMLDAMAPLQECIKSLIYWSEVDVRESEYKSRDGFIPYTHNCGGVEICEIIPKCEGSSFDFLSFGECDDAACPCRDCESECAVESAGHLDAKLRVWLKFEGIESGVMHFYLYLGGGNGDAPYFRTNYEATIFEREFTARSIAEFKRQARYQVRELMLKVFK